jgi:hypothetical protein
MPFHWLTSQLSVTFTDYHTLPVSVSVRDLTRMTAPYKLFPRTKCVELFSSAYKPSIVLAARAVLRHRVYRCYPGNERAAVWRHRGCSQETSSKAVAWRHRCCAEKTPNPLTSAQRVFCRELFSGRCPGTLRCATLAAHPTTGWHIIIHKKAYICTYIHTNVHTNKYVM